MILSQFLNFKYDNNLIFRNNINKKNPLSPELLPHELNFNFLNLFLKLGGRKKIQRLLYFPIAIIIFGVIIIIKRFIS